MATAATPALLALVVCFATLVAVDRWVARTETFASQPDCECAPASRGGGGGGGGGGRGSRPRERAAVRRLAAQIRQDNHAYNALAARSVTAKDASIRMTRLKRVCTHVAPYRLVRREVRAHARTWEKLLKYTNATIEEGDNATSGPEADLTTQYVPTALDDD